MKKKKKKTGRAVSFRRRKGRKERARRGLRREGEGQRNHDEGGDDDLVSPELPDGEDTVVVVLLEGSLGMRSLLDDLEEQRGGRKDGELALPRFG